MNDTINTGGCAFPVAFVQGTDPHGADAAPGNDGMTLLDWFAGQALQGLISKLPVIDRAGEFEIKVSDKIAYNRDVAESCYELASAMLAEKARREATGKDCLQVPDHSPDAGKMARLEEENRELAQALIRCVRLLEVIPEEYVNSETGKPLTHSPDGALANANAVIAKLKNHRRGAGHE